jgi:uncharacterized protein (TIRG00374 family)
MRLDWRGVLGILLSIALLWWALHDVELGEVWRNVVASNPALWLASTAAATAIFALRARRWQVILSPIDERVRFGALWRSTVIGMMVNNVIPARLGELARAYSLTRMAPSIPLSASIASLAVDRVFDALAVMLLMAAAIMAPSYPRGAGEVSERVADTIGLGSLAAAALLTLLYLLVLFPSRFVTLFERVARRVAPSLEARGREVLLAFASGLGVLRSPLRFVSVLLWTLAHWLLNAFAFWLGFLAVGIDVGFGGALLVQGVIVIGVAVPQAPGYVGVFEAAALWTLSKVYGVPDEVALTWAIVFHLLSFIPVTLLGLWYFVRLGLHFRELRDAPKGAAGASPSRAASRASSGTT